MQSILQKTKGILLLTVVMSLILTITSCNEDDENSSEVELTSFGPTPALRGAELKIIGSNLNKVNSVVLAQNVEITEFTQQTSDLITLIIPEETVEGKVTLLTDKGEIVSKSTLGISEPITIASFSPASIKPGDNLTITGTYLNLVEAVIFPTDVSVADFESQSQTEIVLTVPATASSGSFVISNGAEDPILVESETELDVKLPTITAIAPTPVRPGEEITVTGTNLDLTTSVTFPGETSTTEFEVNGAGTELTVSVATDSQDGALKVTVASAKQVTSEVDLTITAPTITNITPDPVKPGNDITVTGTDLDLVTTVTFGGGVEGTITGQMAGSMTVTVPMTGQAGTVDFTTAAKTVTSDAIELVEPSISSLSTTDIIEGSTLTINGANLDLVSQVQFANGIVGAITSQTEIELQVTVTPGATSGAVKLIAFSTSEVNSAQSLNITPASIPVVSSFKRFVKIGGLLVIEGEKMDKAAEVVIGGVTATRYGTKTESYLEVEVPDGVALGANDVVIYTLDDLSTTIDEIIVQEYTEVVDESLVFFDFNGTGNKDFWWNDHGGIESDSELMVDGTSYYRANGTLSGWNGMFWRNGANNFPGVTVGTNLSGYVLKFDINTLAPIEGDGAFTIRFRADSSNDFFFNWAPWQTLGSFETDGWVTISIPLTDLGVTDFSTIDEDFGAAFNEGTNVIWNIAVDNVRFEAIP